MKNSMIKRLLQFLFKLLFKSSVSSTYKTHFKKFTIDDFTKSETAKEHNIDNSIKCTDIGKSLIYTISIAERVRKLLNVDININSGYRCRKLNIAVKGSKNSYHKRAEAFDFTCEKTPEEVCEEIKNSTIPFDQLIIYSWGVHLGCPMKRARRQFLIG